VRYVYGMLTHQRIGRTLPNLGAHRLRHIREPNIHGLRDISAWSGERERYYR